MKIYNNINEIIHIPHPVVTIGTFDGIHLGHQAILKQMQKTAKEIGGETVVVTFYPHPRQVLNIDSSNLRFICSQEDKMKKLEEIGIDNVVVIPFTKEFSRTPSEEFIKKYIIEKIHPDVLIVGYDHHFGKNRMGDFNILYDLGQKYKFKVERIDVQDVEHIAISSTKIRNALIMGNVARANQLLGYLYSVTGIVVSGNEIGRTIGFPTANLEIAPEYMLVNNAGVYACWVDYNGKQYQAMANIGRRPTIGDRAENDFITEVNIFDFDEDIYGKKIKVSFVDRIRDEEKFEDLQALKAQLGQDRETAKQILACR